MMTTVLLTIDTEYSSGLTAGPYPIDRADNFARSIACITPDGPVGITYQLELLQRYGQRAVFFVDPMPAMIWGVAAIEDVVGPILDAGQDVQLHCHTEWLALAGARSILPGRTGDNLKDFPLEDQWTILDYARETLMAAGAPRPVAFRAGNYGANDDTLRALAILGLTHDSSHTPGLPDGACSISLGPEDRMPVRHEGIVEVPIGSICSLRGGQRHAQLTALSLREMRAAIRHARREGAESFTLVSHSFELVNRSTLSINRIVRRRFEGLCRDLSTMRGVRSGTYRDHRPRPAAPRTRHDPVPAAPLRSTLRVAEQFLSNTLYGAT